MTAQVRYLESPPVTADVVVIGGGVVGAATAFHTARCGLRTVLVEARGELAGMTTAVATGGYRLQFESRVEVAVMRESLELLAGLEPSRPLLRPRGYLWVTCDPGLLSPQRELVERQREWGVDGVELLEAGELHARFPYLSPAALQARFRPGDGFLEPRRVTVALAAAAGAGVVCDCPVTGLETSGERVGGVTTTRGPISAGAVVIACGPLSGALAAMAGVELPIAAVRRHKLVCPGLPAVPVEAPMTIDEDTGAHWRPYLGGAALLWNDPAEPAAAPAERVAADPAFAAAVLDPARVSSVTRLTPMLAEIWRSGRHRWVEAGQYTMTPDHLPLAGATAVEGLFVNTGYCGHGVMMSPGLSSRVAVAITAGDEPDDPFAPRRQMREATAGGARI